MSCPFKRGDLVRVKSHVKPEDVYSLQIHEKISEGAARENVIMVVAGAPGEEDYDKRNFSGPELGVMLCTPQWYWAVIEGKEYSWGWDYHEHFELAKDKMLVKATLLSGTPSPVEGQHFIVDCPEEPPHPIQDLDDQIQSKPEKVREIHNTLNRLING